MHAARHRHAEWLLISPCGPSATPRGGQARDSGAGAHVRTILYPFRPLPACLGRTRAEGLLSVVTRARHDVPQAQPGQDLRTWATEALGLTVSSAGAFSRERWGAPLNAFSGSRSAGSMRTDLVGGRTSSLPDTEHGSNSPERSCPSSYAA